MVGNSTSRWTVLALTLCTGLLWKYITLPAYDCSYPATSSTSLATTRPSNLHLPAYSSFVSQPKPPLLSLTPWLASSGQLKLIVAKVTVGFRLSHPSRLTYLPSSSQRPSSSGSRLSPRPLHQCNKSCNGMCDGMCEEHVTSPGALAYGYSRRHDFAPRLSPVPHTRTSTLDTKAVSYTSWHALTSPYLSPLLLTRGMQVIYQLVFFVDGLGKSIISSGTLSKRTVQRKSSMPPICLSFITPRRLSERRKSTSAAYRSVFWWATLRKWMVQHKSSMPPIHLLSITLRGSSERRKSTSAANRFAFWWAFSLTPRTTTGRHKSTSAANLLQPQRPQEILTERHKTSMPPICWGLLGQRLTPRGLTGRHKSASVANLLRPWCPQVEPTERHKSSMPPICWLLPGLSIPLRWATVKQKSVKAADLLHSRWSPAILTVRRKSRRAAKLLVGAGALCFSLWVRYGYGASDVRSRMGRQSHCAWSGWPSEKMPHRRAVLYAGRRRGINKSSHGTWHSQAMARNVSTLFWPMRICIGMYPSFNFIQSPSCKLTRVYRKWASPRRFLPKVANFHNPRLHSTACGADQVLP